MREGPESDSLQGHGPSQFGDAANLVVLAPVAQFGNNLLSGARVPIVRGADLDSGRACQHELDDVFGRSRTTSGDGSYVVARRRFMPR